MDLLHVKDPVNIGSDEGLPQVGLGDGEMNFDEILGAAKGDVRYYTRRYRRPMTVLTPRSPDEPYLIERNAGYFEYQLPVSLKAVIGWKGRLPLLRNERDEWELPGGKLEPGEEPAACLAREIREELAWDATVGDPFHSWVYRVFPNRHVFVLTFLATYDGDAVPVYSDEHKELVLVTPDEVDALDMPEGYRTAIRLAVERGLFQ